MSRFRHRFNGHGGPKNFRLEKVIFIKYIIIQIVEKLYGARFDRNTVENLQKSSKLRITSTYFLKKDIYQVIEGYLVE